MLGIGRPLRPFVVGALGSDLLRCSAICWNGVNVLGLGVLIEVDGLDGECDGLAVRGKLRLADARDLDEALHTKRLLLGGECEGQH